jgi:lipid-A-disaccharide synthase-like uncharacterized protein
MPSLPLLLAASQTADSSGLLEPYLGSFLPFLYNDSVVWSVIGVAGVITFGGRFVIQWLYSEKEKKLVVPDIFWYLSFVGSTLNLTYAVHLDKFPLILGAIFLPPLYLRNIFLMRRKHSPEAIEATSGKES